VSPKLLARDPELCFSCVRCEPGLHNFGQWLKLPTKALIDVELLQELGHWVALPDDPFLLDLQTAPSFRIRTIQGERGTFEELRRVEEDMVIRKEALGWWGVIDSAPKSLDLEGVRLDFEADITSPKLQHAVADAIAQKMGVYDSIHVRRGDKIGKPAFEQLDAETQPGAIMERLANACPPGSRLYIASNEPDEDFFSPLSALYELYTWRDFADLLVEGSIVHQDTSIGCFLDANACQYRVFNNFYLFQIERQVFRKARKHMETYNFLSKHHANGGCCTELEDLSENKSSLVDRY
jgi:hypothetical protein